MKPIRSVVFTWKVEEASILHTFTFIILIELFEISKIIKERIDWNRKIVRGSSKSH